MGAWRMRLVFLFVLLNIIGIFSIIPYTLMMLQNQPLPAGLTTTFVVFINSSVQIIYMFPLILLGLRMQERTNLEASILNGIVYPEKKKCFSKKWLIQSIGVALIGSIFIIILDIFLFAPFISEAALTQVPTPTWWQGLLASLYGGITEETMLRLFGMTFVVWILAKLTKRQKEEIPPSFYYIAIFLTSILFGIGHLPAVVQMFGELSTVLVVRTIVLNSLLGLWFGFVYWKRGLEYAILAHMSADILIHVIVSPLLS